MTSTSGTPNRRRRWQFSLGALLALVTAVSVLLSVGRWIGWGYLALPLLAAYLGGLGVVTFLPLMIVLMRLSRKSQKAIGVALVVAGVLFVMHLLFLVISIESLLRQPFLLDLHPYYGLMEGTLNWTVPSAVAGLLIAPALRKGLWRTPAFWIGGMLIVSAAVAFVWYGHYFFGTVVGDPLANNVWWL
jgi:hypothetical protein